jgi:ketosteroid isomerase-like protein
MNERDDFLAVTIPRQIEAETALHNGDIAPRMAMWSRNDPVTLFGAAVSASGWEEVSRVFEWLASIFSNCESYELEIVAAGASGDLAYTVGYEHTKASVEGVPQTYKLRVTHLYRREDDEWKIVHRHADPASPVNVPAPPKAE